jgi:O-antigen/teichoic acid export membrane protein
MWVVIAQPSVSKAMLMMLIMVIGILPESIRETMRAGFVGQGKITPYAGIATVTGVSRIIVGGGGIFQGWGIETIAFLVVVSDLITNLSGFLILLAGSSYESRRGLHLSIMYQQLRASLPFLAIYTLLVIDGQANVFLLAFFKDESQVGLYGVANTIVIAFTLITQVYLSIALPILTRLYSSDHTRLRLSHSFALWVFMSAALPIALMITFQARDVSALFGRQFESETPVIGVLIWAMVFSWLNAPNSCIMLAAHQESVSAKYLLISLVVGFVLGLVFVPLLGAYGAALGRVGAGFLFWFMHSRFVHQNLVRIPIRFLTGSLLAVLAMAVVACSLGAIIDFWSALLVSLIVYVTILFIGCRKTLSDWYCEWRTCSQR